MRSMHCEEASEILKIAAGWRDESGGAAVAAVVNTWSSSPRPPSARLIVRADGAFEGSVSGGCVEKEVVFAAKQCMEDGETRMLSFGVSDETAWQSGLSCGGGIDVLVSPFPSRESPGRAAFERLHDAAARRLPCALRTSIETGATEFLEAGTAPPAGLQDGFFIEHFLPRRRLFIVGATHIAQSLAPFAETCGFAARVIDPRAAWATAERFPDSDVRAVWPDEAFSETPPDSQTGVVTLAHDPKIDDPAIIGALAGGARYVGALGSARTHEQRKRRLQEAGVSEEDVARIRAPVGLDIGAKTPPEIAAAILAEMVAAFRRS